MDASPEKPDALTRLTPLGARGGHAAILAGLAACFFAFACALPYWRNADMDLIVVYNALLINDGKPQAYFDHPASLLILVTAGWFRLLHAVGLLSHATLSSLPPATDAAAFDVALTQAVRAGRLLALILGLGAVAAFAALMRRIVRDWRIVLLATFALAFSGGIAMHVGRLRSEMLAAALTIGALLILVPAAQRATRARPALIGFAAFLCAVALTSKVHAILLIAAFPVLLLPFGRLDSQSMPPWRSLATARAPLCVLVVVAIAAVAAALPLIREGLDPQTVAAVPIRRFLGLPYGVISAAIALWLVLGVIVFGRIWRISTTEICAALLAIVAGAALGLCTLWISHHPFNAAAVINPVERMLSWAIPYQAEATADALGASFVSDAVQVIRHYSFVFGASSRPTILLVWLIVPAIIHAWRQGEKKVAAQALALIAVAIALDTLGMRRGLKAEYWVFTDPLIILAGALLLERLMPVRSHRLAWPIGLALIVAHIAISQSGPARTALLRRPPQPVCDWNRAYLPLMPLPFCPR